MMDVNQFKQINDNHGHLEGDLALQEVAHIIKSSTPEYGFAIRYAGDEFLLFTKSPSIADLQAIVSDIRAQLESCNHSNPKNYNLSMSFGIGTFDNSSEDIDHFIARLDVKMYDDKAAFYASHREFNRRNSADRR